MLAPYLMRLYEDQFSRHFASQNYRGQCEGDNGGVDDFVKSCIHAVYFLT